MEYNGCNFYQVLRVCFDADIKFQLFIVLSFVSDHGPRHQRLMTDFIQLEMYSKNCSGYEVIIAAKLLLVKRIPNQLPYIYNFLSCNILIKA